MKEDDFKKLNSFQCLYEDQDSELEEILQKPTHELVHVYDDHYDLIEIDVYNDIMGKKKPKVTQPKRSIFPLIGAMVCLGIGIYALNELHNLITEPYSYSSEDGSAFEEYIPLTPQDLEQEFKEKGFEMEDGHYNWNYNRLAV